MATAKKKAETTGGMTRVRVLCDCIFGKCDDVVDLPAEHIAEALALGVVDSDPTAVAYAESLKG